MTITVSGANLAEIVAQVKELTGGAADAGEAATTSRGRGKGKDKDEKETKQEDGPDFTIDQIRELASKIESDADQDKAIKALEDAGSESISGLEKKSAAVRVKFYEAIQAILEAAAKGSKRKALD